MIVVGDIASDSLAHCSNLPDPKNQGGLLSAAAIFSFRRSLLEQRQRDHKRKSNADAGNGVVKDESQRHAKGDRDGD